MVNEKYNAEPVRQDARKQWSTVDVRDQAKHSENVTRYIYFIQD